jgi:hypothetical protein
MVSLSGDRFPADLPPDDPQYEFTMGVLKTMMENLIIPNLEFAQKAFESWQ